MEAIIRSLISHGCHAGSFCSSCGEVIEELVSDDPVKNMTYRDLLNKLRQAENCQLEQNVSVHIQGYDKFFPVTDVKIGTVGEIVLLGF